MNIERYGTEYLISMITNLHGYSQSSMQYYMDCIRPLCDAVHSQDLQEVYEEEQSLGL